MTNLSTHQNQTLNANSEKAKGVLLLDSSITENDCSRIQWVPDKASSVESRCGRSHAPYFKGVLVEVPKVTELFLAAGWGLGARGHTFRWRLEEGDGPDQGRAWKERMDRGEGRVQAPSERESGGQSLTAAAHPSPTPLQASTLAGIEAAIPIPSVTLA